jgi:hypothetical protein
MTLPTVKQVIAELRAGRAELCVWPRDGRGTLTYPKEYFLREIGVWVRANGAWYSADQGRGGLYPGIIDRWLIRRAVKHFEEGHRT